MTLSQRSKKDFTSGYFKSSSAACLLFLGILADMLFVVEDCLGACRAHRSRAVYGQTLFARGFYGVAGPPVLWKGEGPEFGAASDFSPHRT